MTSPTPKYDDAPRTIGLECGAAFPKPNPPMHTREGFIFISGCAPMIIDSLTFLCVCQDFARTSLRCHNINTKCPLRGHL